MRCFLLSGLFGVFFAVDIMSIHSEICKAFGAKASSYENHALAQTEIGLRLFERLDYLKIKPNYVLDLGCGSGNFTKLLAKKYPKAKIIGLDLTFLMLQESLKKQGWFHRWPLVNADMQQLPFASGVFDLVFANQVLHWGTSLPLVFRELNRVMRAEACLMFSTLGPDTFKELRQTWSLVDNFAHTNDFVDMHDIGDHLLHERFVDPVVDMEFLTLHYPNVQSLVKSLKAQGVRNIHTARNRGLTGKGDWKAFIQAWDILKTPEGKCPLSYEVVYGHAWKGNQGRGVSGIETFIPATVLKK